MSFLRLCVLAVIGVALVAAQDSPDARGLNAFYNLDYDQALADFRQAEQQDPQAIGPHNHVAQTLLFREMYRDGALETELITGNNPFLRRPKLNPSPEIEKNFNDEIRKARSEEHTSELQSQFHLVCRLLLEKKKKQKTNKKQATKNK